MQRRTVVRTLLALLAFFSFMATSCQGGSASSAEKAPTKEEAEAALSSVAPGVKVISVEPSVVTGLWEVAIETQDGKFIIYLDSARRYMFSGQVVDLQTKTSLTQRKMETLEKVEFSSIPLDGSLVMGDPKAKYKAVVFDDPD